MRSNSRENTTVVTTISANGATWAPTIIFKGPGSAKGRGQRRRPGRWHGGRRAVEGGDGDGGREEDGGRQGGGAPGTSRAGEGGREREGEVLVPGVEEGEESAGRGGGVRRAGGGEGGASASLLVVGGGRAGAVG